MNINKLIFRNFKTLEDVSFEPGRVNVFIGANGSGKTTISEILRNKSIEVIDCDKVSKKMAEPGTDYLKAIEKTIERKL